MLSGEIAPPFDRGRGGPGGWWILVEPDVVLEPHQIVVPDAVLPFGRTLVAVGRLDPAVVDASRRMPV